ncbi:branched-chain amino acid ABC transporter permease [Clostridia bacterium]|nr:branched-chain amino acid ABC transporter permease [Clostridia bacterium]
MKTKNKLVLALALLAAVLVVPALIGSSYIHSIIITICIYSIFAISYDLLLGYTGIVSFGHTVYFGVAAYVVAFTTVKLHWPFLAAVGMVIVVCVAISFIFSLVTLRTKNVYFSMVTMAIGQLFYVMSTKLYAITGGDDGLPGVKSIFPNKTVFYIAAVLILVCVYLFSKRLVNSPAGRVLQGVKENDARIGMLGYNTFKFKSIVIQISGLLAGLAGILYVNLNGIATPSILNSSMTLQILFMVILGGVGTLHGPVIGAAIMQIASIVLSGFTTRWMLIFGIGFVVVMLFFPKGVAGVFDRFSQPNQLRKE